MEDITNIQIYKKIEPYFYNLIQNALKTNHISIKEYSEVYLISVLCDFIKQEQINNISTDDSTLPSLFSFYQRAHKSAPNQQFNNYRNLGDLSLFVSGFFQRYINRRKSLNNIEYYIDMGAGAYYKASKLSNNRDFNSIFYELSMRFEDIVKVLSNVSKEIEL